jgi:hypothetical protein
VLPEKNIIADVDAKISFRYMDNKGEQQPRTLPGAEFLWLLLQHVLPQRFRRVRDFGILHANSKRLIQLQQILLRVVVLQPTSKPEQRPVEWCNSGGAAPA